MYLKLGATSRRYALRLGCVHRSSKLPQAAHSNWPGIPLTVEASATEYDAPHVGQVIADIFMAGLLFAHTHVDNHVDNFVHRAELPRSMKHL